ncbi:hypothetical protein AXX17_AT5G15290 [Arabidopsis thaliana]|uniref:Uncharacterized protein n=1 Tax=Arabidopsis thaliana TaxID=3702 RepID=A0A178UG21_ARATH|nr:hypothetical protein AXX17_AT5G15290 [Arabidopsis thaliana]
MTLQFLPTKKKKPKDCFFFFSSLVEKSSEICTFLSLFFSTPKSSPYFSDVLLLPSPVNSDRFSTETLVSHFFFVRLL